MTAIPLSRGRDRANNVRPYGVPPYGKTRSEMSNVNEIISLAKNDSHSAAARPRPRSPRKKRDYVFMNAFATAMWVRTSFGRGAAQVRPFSAMTEDVFASNSSSEASAIVLNAV